MRLTLLSAAALALSGLTFPAPASAQVATLLGPETATPDVIAPRATVRHDFGSGVGYSSGYTYGEGFIPLRQGDGTIVFANVRVLNFDQQQYWEAQGGGGVRWMLPNRPWIFGVNSFYDGRNTDRHFYNQLGFGWELLGCCWEARGNVYIPVGQQRFLVGQTAFFNPRFIRTNIAVNQTQVFESSAGGVDVEVGRQLPRLFENSRTMLYAGFYHYSNDNIRTANGVRGRLETWFGENMSLHMQVQNDGVYDTTVTGGLALHYGGVQRGFRREDPLYAKLGNRVVRDPNVVLQRTTETHEELLIDPATGKPIEVRHTNSNAAPGGDGSFEHPFQNLNQLQTGSGPNMILYLYAGSVFKGQNLTLQPNQRLLGEGIDHIVVATQGTFLLPRATGGSTLPIIQNSLGNAAVTLASNTEVSGVQILSPRNNGIFGVNVANVNINRNIIRDMLTSNQEEESSPYGINLRSASGNIVIQGNTISTTNYNFPTAIYTDYTGNSQATVLIANNNISSTAFIDGVIVELYDSAVVRGQILANSINPAFSGGAGIWVNTHDDSKGTFQVANNFLVNADVTLQSSNSSFLNTQLANNTADTFNLFQFHTSSFNTENTLGSNAGGFNTFGTITIVPVGTYFPAPDAP